MKKRFYLIFVLVLFVPAAALGDQTPGTTGADFLKIGVGARQAAMGDAFTAVADDATAMYWNPGGLGFANRWNINMAGNRWLFDTWHGSIFAAKHICVFGYQRTALGIGAIGLGMPTWNSTNDPNATEGKANDIALIGSVGQRIDWLSRYLSIGLSAKYIQRTLMDESTNGLGLDTGVMFRAGRFKAGLAMNNTTITKIKFVDEEFKLPTTVRGGISISSAGNLLLAADLSKPIDNEMKLHFGAEKWFSDRFAVRFGYKAKTGGAEDIGSSGFSGFTTGLGIRWGSWQFDYAFSNYDDIANDVLNATHQLSVSLRSPNALDPFSLKSPPHVVDCKSDYVHLTWEPTFEHDGDRPARYLVVLDTDKQLIERAIEQFERAPNPERFRPWIAEQAPLLFREMEDTRIRLPKRSGLTDSLAYWYVQLDEEELELQSRDTLYWTVLAFEEETGLWKVCKQRVGHFTCYFLPDPTFRPYK